MALGKGLGALLGDAALYSQEGGSVLLRIEQIEAAANQPRKYFDEESLGELADSIRTHGVLQPITVRRLSSGYYQIIAGERRWRAARLAGLIEVPAMVVDADEKTAMELALIENLQREDLNAIEEAEGFRALIEEHGLTQEEVSQRVGRSRSSVANSLRLLTLPDELRELVERGAFSPGHARAVMKLKSERQQLTAASIIIEKELSVRQAETFAAKMANRRETEPRMEPVVTVNYLEDIEKNLSACLGRRVNIVSGKKKGRLEIEYYGGDDLQALISALEGLKL